MQTQLRTSASLSALEDTMPAPSPFSIPPSEINWSSPWWTALWHRIGHHNVCPSECPATGQMHPDYHAAEAWARTLLKTAGYQIDYADDIDAVDIAESLMTLAALYCPQLRRR
ncbi:hypothetical protein ACI8AV_17900 [Geodermatophilus sp. SYSU D00804]